ncbi:MAG: radical SAM protein [Oscillospiraceae bacterium]|nr:radical SAM protein [Oscillospiraceae bacterium]
MKARRIPRIDIHDRIELKNALPLRTPFVVHIDPCDTCNFRCKFCPSGDTALMKSTKGRGHGPMDYTMFCRIIDELGEFPDPIRVVRLYKEGEPLVNARFADMVRYAKSSGHVLRVDTTTNGSLLTRERSLAIIDAGLDRINISVEGMNAEQYRDFSGYRLDFGQFTDNIAFFYEHRQQCEVNIKINGDTLTPGQEEEFYRVFGDISDGISVERTIEYWPKYKQMRVDFDEDVSILGGSAREVQVCPYVFYEMCVNSDGTYSLCRFDWNHAMLLDRHVGPPPTPKKIWDSIVLWQFQQQFLRRQRLLMTVLSCPKCGVLKQGVPEDLDEFADEILDRM